VILFFQALFALVIYDCLRTFCSFRAIHSTVRRWRVVEGPIAHDTIERVCAALNHACVWYPKQALCLQRSFVTTYLLRKRGVPAQMVLGAQKLPFKAHAWVEVSGRPVNERSDVQAIYGVWERC